MSITKLSKTIDFNKKNRTSTINSKINLQINNRKNVMNYLQDKYYSNNLLLDNQNKLIHRNNFLKKNLKGDITAEKSQLGELDVEYMNKRRQSQINEYEYGGQSNPGICSA